MTGQGGEKLDALFKPRSIALVGVSRKEESLGRRPLKHLQAHGYDGELAIIHPTAEEIGGVAAVRSLSELDSTPDLVFVATHGDVALGVVEEAVEAGVPAVSVISSFGTFLDSPEAVRSVLAKNGTRMLGPNGPGHVSVNPPVAAHISHFLTQNEHIRSAPIGLITQSGAIGGIIANSLLEAQVGFDWLVTTGNEFDLGLGEALEYLALQDLRAVGLFVESVRDLDHFRHGLELARENGVRVCAVKVGQSSAGERQALTHTGALTGAAELFAEELAVRGGTLCRDLDELAAFLSVATLPRPTSRRLAVASSSGGFSGLLADRAMARGMDVPELPGLENPWDTNTMILEDPEGVGRHWKKMLDGEGIGAGLIGYPAMPAAILDKVSDGLVEAGIEKPFVIVPPTGVPDSALQAVAHAAVSIPSTEMAVAALDWWTEGSEGGTADSGSAPPAEVATDEAKAKRLLREAGVPVPAGEVVADVGQATAFAADQAGPLVLKCLRPALAHKAANGGVRLNLEAEPAPIEAAWEEMAARIADATGSPMEEALIEAQAPAGLELLVSIDADPTYGPFLVLGSGGSAVEAVSDVVHRMLPVTEEEIVTALGRLRIAGVLAHAARIRGEDGSVPRDLVSLVAAIAALADDRPGIMVEVNPVIVPLSSEPPIAVDCVVVEAGDLD